LTLLLLVTGAGTLQGDDTLKDRGPWPFIPGLADRFVIDRSLRGNTLEVIRWTSEEKTTSPSSHYYLGETLSSLGLVSRAASAYMQALQRGTPQDSWWTKALVRYLELLELSPVLPGLEIPAHLDKSINGDAALYFGAYLQREGETERALELLKSNHTGSTEILALSTAAVSQVQATSDNWDQALATLSSFRTSETSAVTDLVYLLQGYGYLEINQPRQARESFLTIPPSSPFSPEALFGQSWSLIKAGDLPKAAVRLQELIDQHPYTPAARKAIIDLALCFRELGLYDNATEFLSRESDRLQEMSSWLNSLNHSDLRAGGDLLLLIEGAINNRYPDQTVVARTPEFIKQWIVIAAKDPRVRRTTILLNGVRDLKGKLQELITKYLSTIEHIQREVSWTGDSVTMVEDLDHALLTASNRLPVFLDEIFTSLEQASLEDFASESSISIIGRITSLQTRLRTMETNVEKISGFSPVISSLKELSTITGEEKQLNRIRENAYEGLVSSRNSLKDIRSDLKALEGRVWLHAKGEARRTEMNITDRVLGISTRIVRLQEKTRETQNLLTVRLSLLTKSREELNSHLGRLKIVLSKNLSDLESDLRNLQITTLQHVAGEVRAVLEEEEAKAVFSAADIEIMKIENNLRAMQENIP
jgi:tetratricopeptide (TPR) repeat protein